MESLRAMVYPTLSVSISEGIATARGGKWWPATIRYVLDNPKYRGQVEYLFRWNGSESHIVRPGSHAVLVDPQ
jgi:site-specific DNA recombinase